MIYQNMLILLLLIYLNHGCFLNNEINKNINWVSYLPNLTQVQKIINTLSDNGFENLELKKLF